MEGWIKLNRDIVDSDIWKDKNPYDYRAAYIDLMFMAFFKDQNVITRRKKVIPIKRGQVFTSEAELTKRWYWSRNKVRHFLGVLEGTSQGTVESTSEGTIITLINYGVEPYSPTSEGTSQGTAEGTTEGTTQGTAKGTAEGTHRNNVKERKKEKNVNNNMADPSEELFNELWELYPRKMGKASVSKKAKQEIFKIGFDRMADAIERYKKQIAKNGTREEYVLYGSTFFNTRYADFLEDEKPTVTEQVNEQPEDDDEDELTDEEWMLL